MPRAVRCSSGLTSIGREDAFPGNTGHRKIWRAACWFPAMEPDNGGGVDLTDKRPAQFKQKRELSISSPISDQQRRSDSGLIGLSGIQPQKPARDQHLDPGPGHSHRQAAPQRCPFPPGMLEEQWRRLLLSRRKKRHHLFPGQRTRPSTRRKTSTRSPITPPPSAPQPGSPACGPLHVIPTCGTPGIAAISFFVYSDRG